MKMSQSSITSNEWTRITQLMKLKLGSDAFDRLFKAEEITVRENFALTEALKELFGTEEYQQLWQFDGINGDGVQLAIDNNIRAFLSKYEGVEQLTQADKIVPRMPFTSLTFDEIALIELIIEFKIGDLWKKAYDTTEGTNNFTSDDSAKLQALGNELMGLKAYAVYSQTDIDNVRDLTEFE